MFITTLLTTALAAAAPTDTVRLLELRAFGWSRRPEVLLVTSAADSGRVRVILTARDPQHFASDTLALYPDRRTDGTPLATFRSDSSDVDARMSSSLHTLWFWVDAEELRTWSRAPRPAFRVGDMKVRLEPLERDLLAKTLSRSPANRKP